MKGGALLARANIELNKKSSGGDKKREDDIVLKNDKEHFEQFWRGVTVTTLAYNQVRTTKTSMNKFNRVEGSGSMNKSIKLESNHNVFNPDGKIKIWWDVIIGLFILYSVITIPFAVGFQVSKNTIESTFESCVDAIFMLDIFLTFNTSFVDTKTELIVSDRKIIAQRYLHLWFWIDFISTVPFDTIVEGISSGGGSELQSIRLVKILRLSRMLKLFRVMRLNRISTLLQSYHVNPALLGVQTLIGQICFVAHIVCCFWFFIGLQGRTRQALVNTYTNDLYPPNWIVAYGMHDKPLSEQYVASFYWTITTMLSIGYGDIHAYNSNERVYTIFTQFVGSIMFGAVIAQVTRLIASRNPQARAFKEKVDELKAYLNEKLLPNQLKIMAKDNYRYFLTKKSAFAENGIIEGLPISLLNPLVMSIYVTYIRRISLFHNMEESFVVQLFIYSKPFQAAPNTLIVERGDVADELIFIIRGVVQFTTSDDASTAVTGYSSDGGYFGDFEYYKKITRLVSHRTAVFSSFISFPTEVLDSQFLSFPRAKSKLFAEFEKRYVNYVKAKASTTILNDKTKVFYKSKMFVNGDLLDNSIAVVADANISKFSMRITVDKSNDCLCTVVPGINKKQNGSRVEEIRSNIHKRYILLPDDSYKVRWDVAVGVLIIFSVIAIPVQICFQISPGSQIGIFDTCTDVIFFCDMLITCRTAYFDEEHDALMTIPQKIYEHYFKTWFWIDLFSVVPFDKIFLTTSGSIATAAVSLKLLKVIRLARLLKLTRLVKLRKYLDKFEENTGVNPATFALVTMMLQVLFVGHLICCAYWYLCFNISDKSWLDVLNLRNAPLQKQYITTLYFTFTTVSTVGYGDIVPVNSSERLIVIVIMIFGATIFGYIAANVSTLMGSMDVTAARINSKISEITEYLQEKSAPSNISNNIVKHYKYKLQQSSAFDEQLILSRLPLHVSRKMIAYQHSITLSHIAIFHFIQSRGVILFLFRRMSSSYHDVGHVIAQEGAMGSEIHFVITGFAGVYRSKAAFRKSCTPSKRRNKDEVNGALVIERQKSIPLELCDFICDLAAGDFLGHNCFVDKLPYTASVVAKTPCSMYSLSDIEIARIIRDFPAVALALQGALGNAIMARNLLGREFLVSHRANFIIQLKREFIKRRAHQIASTYTNKNAKPPGKLATGIIRRLPSIDNIPFLPRTSSSADVITAQDPSRVDGLKSAPSKSDISKFPFSKFQTATVVPVETNNHEEKFNAVEKGRNPSNSNVEGKYELADFDDDNSVERSDAQVSNGKNEVQQEHNSNLKGNISTKLNNPHTVIIGSSQVEEAVLQQSKQINRESVQIVSKWSMIGALVKDPASISILQSSAYNETDVFNYEAPVANKSQDVELAKKTTNENVKIIRRQAVISHHSKTHFSSDLNSASTMIHRQKSLGSVISLLTEPISLAKVVKKQIDSRKRRNVLLMTDGIEFYDSDEDKQHSSVLYALKCRGMLKRYRSCTNLRDLLHGEEKSSQSTQSRRRMSFPSNGIEDWKVRIKKKALI